MTTQAPREDARIKKTIVYLDAILGLQDDNKPKAKGVHNSLRNSSKRVPEDLQRLSGSIARDDIEGQFQKIIEKARRLADAQFKKGSHLSEQEQAKLRVELEDMLTDVSAPEAVDKEDMKKLKEAAFGPQTFWITEATHMLEAEQAGLLIRGNLRDERSRVFAHIRQKVRTR